MLVTDLVKEMIEKRASGVINPTNWLEIQAHTSGKSLDRFITSLQANLPGRTIDLGRESHIAEVVKWVQSKTEKKMIFNSKDYDDEPSIGEDYTPRFMDNVIEYLDNHCIKFAESDYDADKWPDELAIEWLHENQREQKQKEPEENRFSLDICDIYTFQLDFFDNTSFAVNIELYIDKGPTCFYFVTPGGDEILWFTKSAVKYARLYADVVR